MTIIPHKTTSIQGGRRRRRVASPPNPLGKKRNSQFSMDSLAAGSTFTLSGPSLSLHLDGRDTLTTFIVENYISEVEIQSLSFSKGAVKTPSQICGAWIEALPVLCGRKEQSETLILAMKALALAILDRGSQKQTSQPEYGDMYCTALKSLRTGISKSSRNMYEEFAAASMCLTLLEVSNLTFTIIFELWFW